MLPMTGWGPMRATNDPQRPRVKTNAIVNTDAKIARHTSRRFESIDEENRSRALDPKRVGVLISADWSRLTLCRRISRYDFG